MQKKSTMLTLKSKLEEHTEDEYLTLIERLFKGYYSSEKEHDEIVEHIVSTSEHPDRTGILYDPGQNIEDSPTGVINAIKQWRLENGKTGFKV